MRVTFDLPDEIATHLSRIARGNLMSRALLLRHICAQWLDSYIKVQEQKKGLTNEPVE